MKKELLKNITYTQKYNQSILTEKAVKINQMNLLKFHQPIFLVNLANQKKDVKPIL